MRQDETPLLTEKRKMYVVVRADLPPGLRAAQAGHAIAEMCLRHQAAKTWNQDPDGNYLIILEVPDEKALMECWADVKSWDIHRELFREPDLGLQATAFASCPEPVHNFVFSHLPLAYGKRGPWTRIKRIVGVR